MPADRKAALDQLQKAFQSGNSLEGPVAAAQKAGVPAQTIAELRLISAVRSRDSKELPLRLQEVERDILPHWRAQDSVAFEEKTELESVMTFGKALLAADAGDERLFEESIKQAFWLNPELSAALAEVVKTRRTSLRVASLSLPLALPFETSEGTKTSLGDLARGQKALLLDFWATWCGPCMNSMPQLIKRAAALAPQHVAVVGINTEASQAGGLAEARKKSASVKKQKNIEFAWIIEPVERPISRLLKIDSIPRAILMSPEGKVLFDGHPEDTRLEAALKKIGVSL